MKSTDSHGDAFRNLIEAIVAGEDEAALKMLDASPRLNMERATLGATRQKPKQNFFDQIGHYIYDGDTALHMAAAAHRVTVLEELIKRRADVQARNRRGAEPLHYAVDGGPTLSAVDASAQALIIATLIRYGADPNAQDKSGVAPLHRAVRNRCAAAVKALIDCGANPHAPNKNGSTPAFLATQNTRKSGSGSTEAKAQQQSILEILRLHSAA